ncbi:hypothetical protein ACJ41O_014321 [Fusarium nematophilum]
MSQAPILSSRTLGLGLMGMTWRPEPIPTDEAIEVLRASIVAGCTLWNGADFYGTPQYNSMHLLKAYFTRFPEDATKVTVMIKGGVNLETFRPDGSPEGIRRSIDNILAGLGGVENLNIIFCIARRDHSHPFDVTLKTIQTEYIDTAKLAGVAISECSADTVNEAARHVKITAAEVELSIFTPDILKNGVAAACKEHNIPIVAYSPIGRGMLTGRFTKASDYQYLGRIAATFPRLQDEAIQHNLELVNQVKNMAQKKGVTPAQLAINWVRSMGRRQDLPVIPIPGATTVARMEENSKVIELEDEDMNAVNDLIGNFEVSGTRYPSAVPVEL